jgi:hypothetical protein
VKLEGNFIDGFVSDFLSGEYGFVSDEETEGKIIQSKVSAERECRYTIVGCDDLYTVGEYVQPVSIRGDATVFPWVAENGGYRTAGNEIADCVHKIFFAACEASCQARAPCGQ